MCVCVCVCVCVFSSGVVHVVPGMVLMLVYADMKGSHF